MTMAKTTTTTAKENSRVGLEARGELEVSNVLAREDRQASFVLLHGLHPHHLEVVRVPPLVHVRVRHAPNTLDVCAVCITCQKRVVVRIVLIGGVADV